MPREFILSVDNGTKSVRALVFDFKDSLLYKRVGTPMHIGRSLSTQQSVTLPAIPSDRERNERSIVTGKE